MISKSNLLFAFLFLFSVPNFAQITKGAKTLNVSGINVQFGKFNEQAPKISSSFIFTALVLGIPDFMISDKLQIGAPIKLNLSSYSEKYSTPSLDSKNTDFIFQVNPQVTYFFTKNDQGYFATIGGELSNYKYQYRFSPNQTVNNGVSDLKYALNIGGGYVMAINENIFWRGELNYSKTFESNEFVFLNVGLTNFVKNLTGTLEDGKEYITQGKSILSANLSASLFADNDGRTEKLVQLNFSQMKFMTDHLAFGGYGTFDGRQNTLGTSRFQPMYSIKAGAIARYYLGLTKRWFVYPQLGLGVEFYHNLLNNTLNLKFDKIVGANYFITPNIALDFNVNLNFSSRNDLGNTSISSSGFYSNVNFGLTYFVGKIF